MKIKCDECGLGNKGRYTTILIEGKPFTFCHDCRWGSPVKSDSGIDKDKQTWEHINTPFWKLMGQKPKERDIQLDKYLKHRNMTYGEYRKERDHYLAKFPSAMPEFEKERNK